MFDNFENLPLCHDLNNGKLRTSDVLSQNQVKFSSLLLREEIQNGLHRSGFMYLSPIQKNALPLALTDTSIIAHAKSGTGKTLVYVLTALNTLFKNKSNKVQCLVLAPTREIAKQTYDVFKNVGYFIKDLKVEFFIGGTALDIDVIKCRECHIAIGAPGRIKHLIELGELPTKEIQLLVLDEVDALLNNKEYATMELLSYLPVPKQIIVCTATYSETVKDLLKPISPNIKYITVCNDISNAESVSSNILIGIKQFIAPVFTDSTSLDTIRKRNKLIQILENFKYEQCFVFVNYITIAKSLCNMLNSNKLPALWISSEQNQSTRISTINKLKMNQCRILVTTDLAARGIDVHNVNLVVNMGVPSPPDVYIHRMGRAGRYGSEGAVITVLHEGLEIEHFTSVVCSVITDPVNIYMLPYEVEKDFSYDDLKTIGCTPRPDVSFNNDEFRFKTSNTKNQAVNTCKKYAKKKKKKRQKKEKSQPLTRTPKRVTNCDTESTSNGESDIKFVNADEILSESKEMERLVQGYVESIKEEINCKKFTLCEKNLNNLFEPCEKLLNIVRFDDYSRVPETNANVGIETAVSVPRILDEECVNSLSEHVSFIKRKHAFLDEQKLPVSMQQFLELVKRNENILRNCVPPFAFDTINEIVEKIRELIQPRLPRLTLSTNNAAVAATANDKKSLKRVLDKYRLSDELHAQLNVNQREDIDNGHITWETSNRALERSQRGLARRSSKRSKNHDSSVRHFDDANFKHPANVIAPTTKYAAFSTTKVNCSDTGYNTEQREACAAGHSRNPTHHTIANEIVPDNINPCRSKVTCPNCQFRFPAGPHVNQSFVLQPLRAFVNGDMERNIWQHHFNFISTHVRSLSSIFGNR